MNIKNKWSTRDQFVLERLQSNLTYCFEWIERAGVAIKDGDYRAAIRRLSNANDYLIDAMLNNERLDENKRLDASEYLALAKRAVHAGVKNAKQD